MGPGRLGGGQRGKKNKAVEEQGNGKTRGRAGRGWQKRGGNPREGPGKAGVEEGGMEAVAGRAWTIEGEENVGAV